MSKAVSAHMIEASQSLREKQMDLLDKNPSNRKIFTKPLPQASSGEKLNEFLVKLRDARTGPREEHATSVSIQDRGSAIPDVASAMKSKVEVQRDNTIPPIDYNGLACVESFSGIPVTWNESLESVEPAPALFIAQEFFDAIPAFQFEVCHPTLLRILFSPLWI